LRVLVRLNNLKPFAASSSRRKPEELQF
jgi:hypothetical protein